MPKDLPGGSPLFSLPPEIFEKVIGYVVPSPQDMKYRCDREVLGPLNHHIWADSWRQDAANLRLVCNPFSQLRSISASLFHTIYLYPSKDSLDNLAALSKHHLKTHVRRLVFMYPQFDPLLSRIHRYSQALEADVTKHYKHKLSMMWCTAANRQVLSYEEIEHCAKSLGSKLFHETYAPYEVKNGHKAYIKALRAQRRVLQEGLFVEYGGKTISNFPNLTLFEVRGSPNQSPLTRYSEDENTGKLTTSSWDDGNAVSYLQRRHPEVKIQSTLDIPHAGLVCQFLLAVFRTLSVAKVNTVEELVFSHGAQFVPPFSFNDLPCGSEIARYNRLRCLDVCLTGYLSKSSHWNRVVLPILKSSVALEQLVIRVEEFSDYSWLKSTLDPILGLSFPHLRSFAFNDICVSGFKLARFLRRHACTLQTFKLTHVAADLLEWPCVLYAIRKNFCYGTYAAEGWDESTGNYIFSINPRWLEEQCEFESSYDVKAYVQGREWSDELTKIFGVGFDETWKDEDMVDDHDGVSQEDSESSMSAISSDEDSDESFSDVDDDLHDHYDHHHYYDDIW